MSSLKMNALVRRVVSVMSVRHKLSEEEEYAYVLEVLSAKGLKLNGKKVYIEFFYMEN